jgi:hypothetical protein
VKDDIKIGLKEIGWQEAVPIAQAVSHRLPTAAARFQSHVRLCGFSPSTSVLLSVLIPPIVSY